MCTFPMLSWLLCTSHYIGQHSTLVAMVTQCSTRCLQMLGNHSDNLSHSNDSIQRFSGCLTKIQFKFWCMHTDKRVPSVHLHHLHVDVLPVNMHAIDLTMNTVIPGLDFKYNTCFHRPHLHTCNNSWNGSWSSNLKTSVTPVYWVCAVH